MVSHEKYNRDTMTISNFENIKYDKFLRSCNNSWQVLIDKKTYYFPYSLCDIDEVSKVILCPAWFVIEKELEAYIDND